MDDELEVVSETPKKKKTDAQREADAKYQRDKRAAASTHEWAIVVEERRS